jgi:hypothetical protein
MKSTSRQARRAGTRRDAVKAFDSRFGISNQAMLEQIAKDFQRRTTRRTEGRRKK